MDQVIYFHFLYDAVRGKEASFKSAKMSTLSLIPEESEIRYKDSLKQYICPDGALQSIESSYAATQGMKVSIGVWKFI